MDSGLVYKSNALVQASYRLSVYEQRIVLGCIAQVRRDQPLTDQQLYSVSAQQIADMTGTSLGTAYQNLKSASERLYRREVTLHEAPNGDSNGKTRLTRWVQTVEYRETEGLVALRFGADMVPYLSQLTEQFTRYALTDVARMDSAHAIRLYELLCQWRGAGQREVATEWLRAAFQLGGITGRTKGFVALLFQYVHNAADQRIFGTYHSKINIVVPDKGEQFLPVIVVEGNIFSQRFRPGISGSDIQFFQ